MNTLSEAHERLSAEARAFTRAFCAESHPELHGITDGKAVGTYIESRFKAHLRERAFFVEDEDEGSAAKGIDLPGLQTDIKVTSARQPQSSAPFSRFQQKIEGLGYNLILFVYVKADDEVGSTIDFPSVRFIPAQLTADFQTTKYLRRLILEEGGEVEDVIAYMQDRNVPADEVSLRDYANQLMENPPSQGYLTISNALQWRLQYKRVVTQDITGIRDVLAV
jgi:tRNA isopentenyl-2-thiomethyl-A-37 hydroxylase MiaE